MRRILRIAVLLLASAGCNPLGPSCLDRREEGTLPAVTGTVQKAVLHIRTSDDPSAYRPKTESEAWPLGDPVIRLKNHLILRGAWSEERHKQAEAEIMSEVIAIQKEAETHSTLHTGPHPSARDMFEGVYEQMLPHQRRQRQQAGV